MSLPQHARGEGASPIEGEVTPASARRMKKFACALFALAFVVSVHSTAIAQQQPAPRPGDVIEIYTVQPRDTLIGLTKRRLGSPLLWRENLRLNPQIKDPRRLQPGSRIRLIVSRGGHTAELMQLTKRVEVKPDKGSWRLAQAGDDLQPNDQVRTFDGATAEILFPSGVQAIVNESSVVTIGRGVRPGEKQARTTLSIVDGQIDVKSEPRNATTSELDVVVGSATIAQRATAQKPATMRGRKAADTPAQVMIYRGTSQVESAGRSVIVAAGQGTDVIEGKPPAPPRTLLRAPQAIAPAEGTPIGDGSFRWNPVSGATAYTVEVYRDPAATQLVARATDIHATTWRAEHAFPAGDIFWRVTATDSSGIDGFPGALIRIRGGTGISGTVLEDVTGTTEMIDAPPLANVRVVAWRDDGNDRPDDADAKAAETRTDEAGRFSFDVRRGVYWITVDSTTIQPVALADSAHAGSAWAEQTFGPAGSLCIGPGGTAEMTEVDGPCVGGRTPETSDAPARLSTAKHVARAEMGDEDPPALTFGFSFNVVTQTTDAPEDANERSSQGSLRQFLRNANAVRGQNAMHFVPVVKPGGSPVRAWWTIRASAPLPALTDFGTSIVGDAYDATEPTRRVTPVSEELAKESPDLEIDRETGDGVLDIRASATVRGVALLSGGTVVTTRAPLTAAMVWIGLHPDKTAGAPGQVGIAAESGEVELSYVRISGRPEAIRAAEHATLNATHLTVASAGVAAQTAVSIDSEQSTVEMSDIDGGGSGRGIVLGPHSTAVRIANTHVRHCADGIVIHSSDNRLLRVAFEDVSHVAVLLDGSGATPVRNQISQCDFKSVGELVATPAAGTVVGKPSSADERVEKKTPVEPATGKPAVEQPAGKPRAQAQCAYAEGAPNRGIVPPEITKFETVPRKLLALYGIGCIGTKVEIYQGTYGPLKDAHFVQASVPAYDSTFALLIAQFDEKTRMYVNATDKDGNTSLFAVSPEPKGTKRRWLDSVRE